jgi:sugar diacid utilization regulator
MPMNDHAWFADAWTALLHGPADGRASQEAARLGARAADQGLHVHELVDGALAAGAAWWNAAHPGTAATAHSRIQDPFGTTRALLSAALTGYAEQTRAELDRHDTQRTAFVNDLLTGRTDPGRLAERAHRYGIRLSAAHTVLVARAEGLTPDIVHRIDAGLAARFGEGNTLTTLRNGDLVCISAGGLRGLSAELAHRLLSELGAGRWQIGVGRTHPGLQGLATSLDEAHNTLEHAGRLGFTTPILNAADLLVFPVLLRDRDAIIDLVTTVLGPLATARGGARPYLDTLAVLFDNHGNYTATARQMHLSVRAVTYRLDRIRALTGYHPAEPTQRFTLDAAVLGARLLDWPTE